MAWVVEQEVIEAELAEHPEVVAGVERVASSIHSTALLYAGSRLDTESGRYAASIVVIDLPGGRKGVVATADHAWFVEVGTGIFGPFARPVLAKPGRSFVFYLDANGRTTVKGAPGARKLVLDQHKGRPAHHVMRDAAIAAAAMPGVRWEPTGDLGLG